MKTKLHPCEMLTGLLVGERVTFIGEQVPVGVVLNVGHWYGPPGNQAMVRWSLKARHDQKFGNGRGMPVGLEWDAETVHYIDDLDFSST